MDTVAFDDFSKLDLRVGEILEAEAVEWSEKLIKMTVDFGDPPAGGGKKTVLSGIRQWYQPSDLVGKQAIFIVNLPEKKIKDLVSQAMILTVEVSRNDFYCIVIPQNKTPNGAKVS